MCDAITVSIESRAKPAASSAAATASWWTAASGPVAQDAVGGLRGIDDDAPAARLDDPHRGADANLLVLRPGRRCPLDRRDLARRQRHDHGVDEDVDVRHANQRGVADRVSDRSHAHSVPGASYGAGGVLLDPGTVTDGWPARAGKWTASWSDHSEVVSYTAASGRQSSKVHAAVSRIEPLNSVVPVGIEIDLPERGVADEDDRARRRASTADRRRRRRRR